MPKNLSDDELLQQIAVQVEPAEATAAPSRLKSKIYSALLRRQSETGPLQALRDTRAAGHHLCSFEELVRIAPIGETVKSLNLCRVCHARLLAEHFERPPIYWPNCPYVEFKKS